jgi:hypothetical protein
VDSARIKLSDDVPRISPHPVGTQIARGVAAFGKPKDDCDERDVRALRRNDKRGGLAAADQGRVSGSSVMAALMDIQFVRRTQRGAYVLADFV